MKIATVIITLIAMTTVADANYMLRCTLVIDPLYSLTPEHRALLIRNCDHVFDDKAGCWAGVEEVLSIFPEESGLVVPSCREIK